MSLITKHQYAALAAIDCCVSVQCTERDVAALVARGLISNHQWMSNGASNNRGERLGWLSAAVTTKGADLVAKHEGASA